jgi:hypothetical protein
MHSDPSSWDAHLRDRRRRVHQPSCAPRPDAPPPPRIQRGACGQGGPRDYAEPMSFATGARLLAHVVPAVSRGPQGSRAHRPHFVT